MEPISERSTVLAFLLGQRPKKSTIFVGGGAGLLLAVTAVVLVGSTWWERTILFLLAFDIAAGWTSNLSESTRAFWKKQSRALKVTYIGLHLVPYPLALWAITGSAWVWGLLVIALLGKVGAFVVGLVKR